MHLACSVQQDSAGVLKRLSDRNDVIWIMHQGSIVQKRSMHCPGLDDGRVDVGDPDLEVERPSSDYGVARVLTAVVNRLTRIISL